MVGDPALGRAWRKAGVTYPFRGGMGQLSSARDPRQSRAQQTVRRATGWARLVPVSVVTSALAQQFAVHAECVVHALANRQTDHPEAQQRPNGQEDDC